MTSDKILISCGGTVGVCAVTASGQCNGSGLNRHGQTLRDVLAQHEGKSIVVHDALFGTGYHFPTFHCGAGGAGWGFRLVPLCQEDIALQDAFRRLEQSAAA